MVSSATIGAKALFESLALLSVETAEWWRRVAGVCALQLREAGGRALGYRTGCGMRSAVLLPMVKALNERH